MPIRTGSVRLRTVMQLRTCRRTQNSFYFKPPLRNKAWSPGAQARPSPNSPPEPQASDKKILRRSAGSELSKSFAPDHQVRQLPLIPIKASCPLSLQTHFNQARILQPGKNGHITEENDLNSSQTIQLVRRTFELERMTLTMPNP